MTKTFSLHWEVLTCCSRTEARPRSYIRPLHRPPTQPTSCTETPFCTLTIRDWFCLASACHLRQGNGEIRRKKRGGRGGKKKEKRLGGGLRKSTKQNCLEFLCQKTASNTDAHITNSNLTLEPIRPWHWQYDLIDIARNLHHPHLHLHPAIHQR